MAADGALTDMLTGMLTVFPAPEIVIVPLYVPAARSPGVAVTLSRPGVVEVVVPLAADKLSHEPPEEVAARGCK